MEYKSKSEADMMNVAAQIIKDRKLPLVIELIGDLGAGKTTLVKGIALALGINEPITSPSFTISNIYFGPDDLRLKHYDFYRLEDPGLMADELAESIDDPSTLTIIEWGQSVSQILPARRLTIVIDKNDDDSRNIKVKI